MNETAMIDAYESLHGIQWEATALSVRACWKDAWNAATKAALLCNQPPAEPVQTSAPADARELVDALVDVLPYAEAAIGLTRDRWPHDSVILRAEAAIARAAAITEPIAMDNQAEPHCRIDTPVFLRKHGIH